MKNKRLCFLSLGILSWETSLLRRHLVFHRLCVRSLYSLQLSLISIPYARMQLAFPVSSSFHLTILYDNKDDKHHPPPSPRLRTGPLRAPTLQCLSSANESS